jgi:hypothetical protein
MKVNKSLIHTILIFDGGGMDFIKSLMDTNLKNEISALGCGTGFQFSTCRRGGVSQMSRGCEPNVKEQDNNFGHRSRGGAKLF